MSYSFLSQIEVYLLYSKTTLMHLGLNLPLVIQKIIRCCFFILLCFCTSTNLLAQSNNGGIIFQALARDAFHNPANSRKIYIQTSIIQHSKSGLVVLSEEHITNTDYTGIFTISIGLGSKIGGAKASLEDIDWVNGPYFLNIKIAITPVSPTDDWFFHKEWVDLGTAAFGVVPYALNILGANTSNTSNADSVIYMSKLGVADTSVMLAGYTKKSYVDSLMNNKVNVSDLSFLVQQFDSVSLSNRINLRLTAKDTVSLSNRIYDKLNIKDSTTRYITPFQLAAKTFDIAPINNSLNTKLAINDTAFMLSNYVKAPDLLFTMSSKLNIIDTATMLSARFARDTVGLSKRIEFKLNIFDTAQMINTRFARDTVSLSRRINSKVDLINKSINVSNSGDYNNEMFPSVKAVKDYVDNKISTVASDVIAVSSLSFSLPLVNNSATVSIPAANSTTDGYLTSTNWNNFNNKINSTEKAVHNGIATLGADGKIPSVQIPAISFSRVDVVSSEAAMLALPVTLTGSFAIRTDINRSFVLSGLPASSLLNWVEIVAPGTVTTVNGQIGPAISLTTADIATSIDKRYITDAYLSILSNTSGTNTGDQDLSSYATTTSLASKANTLDVATSLASKASNTDLTTGLANKVDKVVGKELSSNDYTTTEKTKLSNITGTNSGDQDLSSYATTTSLASKANTLDVATSLSLKANASDVATSLALKASNADLSTGLANKVDKVVGKELSSNDYTTTEKTKLSNITGTNTGDQDLSSFATTANLALKANASDVATSLASKASTTDLTTGLALKVDKVTGKELSSNDYTTADKDKLAAITGTNTGDQDLSAFATTTDVATSLASKASTTDLTTGLALKVDKVTGKELSSNDYTTTEKTKLSNITGTNTGDQDLSSFATTTNLASKANTSDVATSLALKANTTDVATSLSLKANASDVTTSLASKANSSDLTTGLALKVDKVTGKELSSNDYTTTEKTKLSNITGTNTGDQDLSSFATTTNLASKANTLDVATSLALKANASDVATSLALKANASDVTTSLASKANTTDVATSLALKANASDVATSLALKASSSDLTTGLANKVDKVTGKELSSNDYTTTEKTKLSNITGTNTGDQDLSSFATLSGTETLSNKTLVIPILGDATATSLVTSGEIKAKRYVQFSNTAVSPPSSGAMTLDLSRGNVIQVDLAYSITGITFTNEAVGTYIIKFKQTVGSKTINFPDAWVWSGGIEPSVTSTVGRTDIVTLINDGTFYYAAIVQNFF
jgi:hypothetical protein